MNMNTVAIYIRVSSEAQKVSGFSIDGQLDALHAYCKEHKLEVFKTYVDAGFSGGSIEGRPSLNELLRDAQKGCFRYVFCWKLNRLSRNLKNLLSILDLFKRHNITFVSITEKFNSETPSGQFVTQMMGSIAEMERQQISQNVKLAVKERNRQGKWNSANMVLGYDWISSPDNKLSHTIINPSEAPLVKYIFELYAKGYGLKAITNRLNQSNMLTKKGKPFGIAAVRGILKNINYAGYIRWGANEISQGEHVPIIPSDLWEVVQSKLAKRKHPPNRTIDRSHPLSGVLKCPQCGHSMIPSHANWTRKDGKKKTYHYYVCENYSNRGKSICSPNLISADSIEQWFSYQLEQLVTKPEIVDVIFNAITEKNKAHSKPTLDELKRLKVTISSLDEKKKRYFQLYEDGFQTRATFVENLNELKLHREENIKSIQAIEINLEETTVPVIPISKVKAALAQLWTALSSANESQQRQLLKLMIEKITIPHDRNIEKAKIYTHAALMHIQLPVQLDLKEEYIQ